MTDPRPEHTVGIPTDRATGIATSGLPNTRDEIEIANELNELVQANVDSADGFRAAASETQDAPMRELFGRLAGERQKFGDELRHLTVRSGLKPTDNDRSTAATAHQWWMRAKARIKDDGDKAILDEARRGEEAIRDRYEKVLKHLPEDETRQKVHDQYEQVCRDYKRVKELSEAASQS